MRRWKLQHAKAQFSGLLKASLVEGPQIVTKHGVDVAVLVPIGEWRRLEKALRPSLKELLLTDECRVNLAIPARRQLKRRLAAQPA